MATSQHGEWSLVLCENNVFTAPLVLQRDLRVTSATLRRGPRDEKLDVIPCFKVNGGDCERLGSELGNNGMHQFWHDLDKLFLRGDSVQFAGNWWFGNPCSVKLEGRFEGTNEALEKPPTAAECSDVDELKSTGKQLSEEVTATETRVVAEMPRDTETTDLEIASKQALMREPITSVNALADKRHSDTQDCVTKQMTNIKDSLAMQSTRIDSIQGHMTATAQQLSATITETEISTAGCIDKQMKSLRERTDVHAASTKQEIADLAADVTEQLSKQANDTTAQLSEVSVTVREMTATMAEQISAVTASVKNLSDEMAKKLWQAEFVGQKLKEELDTLRLKYGNMKEKHSKDKEKIESLEGRERNYKVVFDKLKAKGVVVDDF